MRVLERSGAQYEVLTFPQNLHSAIGVAEYLGIPPDQVFKTLVVQKPHSGKPYLVMVPGDGELDLKKFAQSVGEKKLHMVSYFEAERLTRLKVGGISALAVLNRGFQICLDRSALGLDRIVVSAGQRGVNLRVGVQDLVEVTGCRIVDAI